MNNWFAYPDAPVENIYGSDPGYDEAEGPRNPHHFLLGEDGYIPIEEVPTEDGPNRFVVIAIEDPMDREQRLHWQDPDEPLGHGETVEDVRRTMKNSSPLMVVECGYVPPVLGPTKVAFRNFKPEEVKSATSGSVTVRIRKFDRAVKRWVRVNSSVRVAVRKNGKPH